MNWDHGHYASFFVNPIKRQFICEWHILIHIKPHNVNVTSNGKYHNSPHCYLLMQIPMIWYTYQSFIVFPWNGNPYMMTEKMLSCKRWCSYLKAVSSAHCGDTCQIWIWSHKYNLLGVPVKIKWSYLYNGNTYTGKAAPLYFDGPWGFWWQIEYIDGYVQERRNSSANALELHLSCTNPWICGVYHIILNDATATCMFWQHQKPATCLLVRFYITPLTTCLCHVEEGKAPEQSHYIDGLGQDCSNSSALAMELLQSCAKPLICQRWSKMPEGGFPWEWYVLDLQWNAWMEIQHYVSCNLLLWLLQLPKSNRSMSSFLPHWKFAYW